jgi:nucleotide-binding universal stress UspA family protein
MDTATSRADPNEVRRVVVGFDGSASAGAALSWAVEEARLHDAPLEVWAVVDAPEAAEVRASFEQFVAGTSAELRTDSQDGHGGVAAALCQVCDPSDLLVVGSRGRNPVAGLLLGSVSQACLAHAPCSVVVVRPVPAQTSPHDRVIVGIDTSSPAGRVLHLAASEARLRGAELDVIHAVQWDQLQDPQLIVPATRQLVSWTTEVVDEERVASGVAGRPIVVNGEPAHVLVRRSADADLLVLGSLGHSPLGTLAMGSTSDYCTRHAACPVMVVRPEQDERHASPL